ncbi:hypothetical protein G5C51_23320 [Streptomyces sp. A7024]|uniref:Uncharacterized protein n=1 Tax=Streptomyces coryli TaxID=1128680 RepID=A0A6G4U408_9ACTN|nr:hypothetical protein [Streptomyces coryli]NGN66823.1 hypothetical protein [Streptomyces coryli]
MSNEPHDPPYGGEQPYGYETPLPYEVAPEQQPHPHPHLHPHQGVPGQGMPAAPGDGYDVAGGQDPYATGPDSGAYITGLEGQPGWDAGVGPEPHAEAAYPPPVPEQGSPQPSEGAGYATGAFAGETAYLPHEAPGAGGGSFAETSYQSPVSADEAHGSASFPGASYQPHHDSPAAPAHVYPDAAGGAGSFTEAAYLPDGDGAQQHRPEGALDSGAFAAGTYQQPAQDDSFAAHQGPGVPATADPLASADPLGGGEPVWPEGWERPAQADDGPQTEIGAVLPDAPGSAPTGRRRRMPGGHQAAEPDAAETAYLPPVTNTGPTSAPTGRRRRQTPGGEPPHGVSPDGQSPVDGSPHSRSPHSLSPHGLSPDGPAPHGLSPDGRSPLDGSPLSQSPHGPSPTGPSPDGRSPLGGPPHGQSPHSPSPTGPSAAAVPDVAETAYLPPITDDSPAPDVASTAYLPPITDDTPPPPGVESGRPAGTATGHPGAPGPGHPSAGAPAAAGIAPPGSLRPDGEMGPPTLHGAPARRRPAPPASELRADGRSPIIWPGGQPAAVTAGIGLLLLLATAFDTRPGLAGVVAALQVVTAAGWFRLNGMWPARQGIALAAAGGITATASMLAFDRAQGPAVGLGALGAWSLVIIIVQLRNTTPSDDRLNSLTATVGATLFAVLAAGYLAAEPDAVITGAAAVSVATLVRAVPLPPITGPVVAALAAAAAGFAAGEITGLGTGGALLGLAAGCSALIGLRTASYDFPSRFVHMTAGVTLPLALATPAIYLLGRALA